MSQDAEISVEDSGYARHEAAFTIQNQYRDHLKRSKSKLNDESLLYSERHEEAAKTIQGHYRDHVSKRQEIEVPEIEIDDVDADEQFLAALTIQNHYRNHLSKKRTVRQEEDAARTIQQHYRTYKLHSDEKFEASLKQAVDEVQTEYVKLNEDEEVAALKIQKFYRERLDFKEQEKAATLIQNKYREHLQLSSEKKAEVNNDDEENAAASKIQKRYRERLEAKHQAQSENDKAEENAAALTIQKRYREHLEAKHHEPSESNENEAEESDENVAALKIQNHYRKHLDTKRQTEAAVRIQRGFRDHLRNKATEEEAPETAGEPGEEISESELLPELAAITIQKHYHTHFEKRSKAATHIQRQFRAHDSRRREEEATVQKENDAAKFIQSQYKAHLVNRQQKEKEVAAATAIQKQYRVHAHKIGDSKTVHLEQPPIKSTALEKKKSPRKEVEKIAVNSNLKTVKKDFEKEWPKSKKSITAPKNKLASTKRLPVQTSLELKREQRKHEKNNRKDKFHLNKLKVNKDKPEIKPDGSKKVKADTPQVTQVTFFRHSLI